MTLARDIEIAHQKAHRLLFDRYMRGWPIPKEIEDIYHATKSLSHFYEWAVETKFDPNQPRDELGRWTDMGEGRDIADSPKDKIKTAIVHLLAHALPHYKGRCARYVREALNAGGIPVQRTEEAQNYGPQLEKAGFQEVIDVKKGTGYPPSEYDPQAGDVVVIQGMPDTDSDVGHVAMFDGVHWTSDTVQKNGFWPNGDYREQQPAYKIYRYTH